MQRRFLLLLALGLSAPAQAGLFSDDEMRKQVQQLEERVANLDAAREQQTKAMLGLQGQIESLTSELRNLRGRNEELAHGLQDAEKREKDFYIDLDTRLRRFEPGAESLPAPAAADGAQPAPKVDEDDPVAENRAYEAAYSLSRNGAPAAAVEAWQHFVKQFPDSVFNGHARFWLGEAQRAAGDCAAAIETTQALLKQSPDFNKAPDAMLTVATCQYELKQPKSAKNTVKQLLSKFPDSEAAAQAKALPGSSQ